MVAYSAVGLLLSLSLLDTVCVCIYELQAISWLPHYNTVTAQSYVTKLYRVNSSIVATEMEHSEEGMQVLIRTAAQQQDNPC